MKFRFHRGCRDDSMKTMFEVKGFCALESVLGKICALGFATSIRDLTIEYYCYDSILKSSCFLVSHKLNGPVGFLWDI